MIQSIWEFIVNAFTKPNLQRNIIDDLVVGVISMAVIVLCVVIAAYTSVLIDDYKLRKQHGK